MIEILDIPKNKRETEEYVRLICIAKILGFDRIALMLVKEAEQRINEVYDYIIKIRHDFPIIQKWMNDFIANVPLQEFKQILIEGWQEKIQNAGNTNFSLNNLF